MTRFVYTPLHSKPWFVLLLLAALLLPVCVQAELRAALSAQIIDELDSTVVYKDGSLGPARLEIDASSGAREAHGDRVVAFAGAVMLLDDANPDAERPDPNYGMPDFSLGNMLNMDELL